MSPQLVAEEVVFFQVPLGKTAVLVAAVALEEVQVLALALGQQTKVMLAAALELIQMVLAAAAAALVRLALLGAIQVAVAVTAVTALHLPFQALLLPTQAVEEVEEVAQMAVLVAVALATLRVLLALRVLPIWALVAAAQNQAALHLQAATAALALSSSATLAQPNKWLGALSPSLVVMSSTHSHQADT
jgi:hypothetical protein